MYAIEYYRDLVERLRESPYRVMGAECADAISSLAHEVEALRAAQRQDRAGGEAAYIATLLVDLDAARKKLREMQERLNG